MVKEPHKNPWTHTIDDLCTDLKTHVNNGLTSSDAYERLEKFGLNILPETKKVHPLKLFFSQFTSLIVWVLIGALIISGILGSWIDALSIGIIIVLNAIIGFTQEYRAEKSLEALRKLTKPTSRVIRDGLLSTIPSSNVVPGDIIVLEEGEVIPADGRIIKAVLLSIQEASLTGESLPVPKQIDILAVEELPIGDRKNMAFMGTIVVRGKGQMIITQTGTNTELGAIATMLQIPEEITPLQRQLEDVGKQLVIVCIGIVVLVFVLGLLHGHPFITILLTSLSLAVAAIPEGLPAVVTVALALGVHRMAKCHALVRRLAAVETLGCASVICSDKTGTLTKNEMTVTKLWVNEQLIEITGNGYLPHGQFILNQQVIDPHQHEELMQLLRTSVLCNGASLHQKEGIWNIIGDPTEGSLLVVAAKATLEKQMLETHFNLLSEVPFDTERKRMSMLRKVPGGATLFVKGAPDVMLMHATKLLLNGKVISLTADHKKKIQEENESLASQALRVLAFAYKPMDVGAIIDASSEHDLIFIGLAAMIDPPRPEVKIAIQTCKKAGIRTIMITGDHANTAHAIGKELGLVSSETKVLTGRDLDMLQDDELKQLVKNVTIYARTTAEHKMRIVKAWKAHGEVVAVTGDGVNDAPAIKMADIGIAMGITGTDVTKEASDMVIIDDNFASIVEAVKEGRGIYDNIIKFVNYMLSTNIAELLVIFTGTFLNFQDLDGNPYVSLLPIQILWLNLITDGLPALALTVDPIDPHVMNRAPRKPSEKLLSGIFLVKLFSMGFILSCAVLISCHYGLRTSAKHGHTMTLAIFILLEFARVMIIRTHYKIAFFSNKWLIIALFNSLLLQLLIMYLPAGQQIFNITSLELHEWLVIVGISLVTWLIMWLVEKFFER